MSPARTGLASPAELSGQLPDTKVLRTVSGGLVPGAFR